MAKSKIVKIKQQIYILVSRTFYSLNRRVDCMTGYRCTNMVVKITQSGNVFTLGVVEGMDIDLGYEGGPEAVYGSRTKKHSAGSKTVTFTLTRWFYADDYKEDLLLDLFDGELEFDLEGYLIDNSGDTIAHTSIKITGCRLYRWRPRTGGADDIIGEEASGSGTGWTIDVEPTASP